MIKISLKFVPKGPINHKVAFLQLMDWPQKYDKSLCEPGIGRTKLEVNEMYLNGRMKKARKYTFLSPEDLDEDDFIR